MKQIDCLYWIHSDWSFLGHERLLSLAREHGATVRYLPVDLPAVYLRARGIRLAAHAAGPGEYRLSELRRWGAYLGVHVGQGPKFSCPNGDLASRLVIAALRAGHDGGLLSAMLWRAQWVHGRDISDRSTLLALLDRNGLDGLALMIAAGGAEVEAEYRTNTGKAISLGMFGSPSLVFGGEVFWGADRLGLLERKLKLGSSSALT